MVLTLAFGSTAQEAGNSGRSDYAHLDLSCVSRLLTQTRGARKVTSWAAQPQKNPVPDNKEAFCFISGNKHVQVHLLGRMVSNLGTSLPPPPSQHKQTYEHSATHTWLYIHTYTQIHVIKQPRVQSMPQMAPSSTPECMVNVLCMNITQKKRQSKAAHRRGA